MVTTWRRQRWKRRDDGGSPIFWRRREPFAPAGLRPSTGRPDEGGKTSRRETERFDVAPFCAVKMRNRHCSMMFRLGSWLTKAKPRYEAKERGSFGWFWFVFPSGIRANHIRNQGILFFDGVSLTIGFMTV